MSVLLDGMFGEVARCKRKDAPEIKKIEILYMNLHKHRKGKLILHCQCFSTDVKIKVY